jgi:hypothetical protein
MARKSNAAASAGEVDQTPPAAAAVPSSDIQADGGQAPIVDSENENSSEEVMVVSPAADEPVRCGGYVLTDNGWVVEDDLVPTDDEGDTAAPETEQE